MFNRYFRALTSAAPLKLFPSRRFHFDSRHFRALTSAAPLKHQYQLGHHQLDQISALSRARPH